MPSEWALCHAEIIVVVENGNPSGAKPSAFVVASKLLILKISINWDKESYCKTTLIERFFISIFGAPITYLSHNENAV